MTYTKNIMLSYYLLIKLNLSLLSVTSSLRVSSLSACIWVIRIPLALFFSSASILSASNLLLVSCLPSSYLLLVTLPFLSVPVFSGYLSKPPSLLYPMSVVPSHNRQPPFPSNLYLLLPRFKT